MTLEEAIKILSELHDQCCQIDNIFCTDTTGARCEAVDMAISALQVQDVPDTNVGDMIDRKEVNWKLTALVNEFEDILSHIREREVNDSVCGLCEYDGAYIGQSGDWCNECPGFERDDCFKLKEKYREEWVKIDG